MARKNRRPYSAGMSRRAFLSMSAAAAAGVAAGIHGSSRGVRLATAGPPFAEPAVLASRSGVLSLALEAKIGPVALGGVGIRNVYAYNQQFPGPTLMVRPGDRLEIQFTNKLVGVETNLHFHGTHVSPAGISDNVYLHVLTDETQAYRIDFPVRHSSGLNWYHPHGHATGVQQGFGGLAAVLLIEGGLDDHPQIRDLPDRIFVIQATKFDGGGNVVTLPPPTGPLVPGGSPVPLSGLFHFVNGQLNPTVSMVAGRRERWRFLNATVSSFYNITLLGHTFHQIAADGEPFDVPVEISSIPLSPANRVEVLVEVDAVGTSTLDATLLLGPPSPPVTLATLDVTGSGSSPALPTRLLPFLDLRQDTVDRQRTIHFNLESLASGNFVIDGKTFDPDRVDQAVPLGDIEEWTVVNDQAAPVIHPLHIHTNNLLMTHRNGVPIPVHGFQDTVDLPPAGGSVTLRMHFAEFTGSAVFHCHIIPHADRGMMARLDITSGGVLPTPPTEVGFSIAARGTDGGIYRNRFNAHQWVGWEALAGATLDTPAICTTEGGRVDMVVRGLDSGIYHAHFDSTAWTLFQAVGGATLAAPVLVAGGGRTLELVVRGLDNGIYHAHYDATTWSSFQPLGGATTETPALVENAGVIDVVVRGLDNLLYHARYSGSTWSPFQPVGGATADAPALVDTGRGTLALVVRGLDNGIYYARYDGATWLPYEALGGATPDAPELAAYGDGTLVLVVRGLDNGLYYALHDGASWSGFSPIGGATNQAPTLAATAGGMVDLVVQGLDGNIYHARFDGTVWSAFLTVGGAASSLLAIAAE
jgi:FtsP/CotA-like multicopper oxidase with cupredoxin domain